MLMQYTEQSTKRPVVPGVVASSASGTKVATADRGHGGSNSRTNNETGANRPTACCTAAETRTRSSSEPYSSRAFP